MKWVFIIFWLVFGGLTVYGLFVLVARNFFGVL